MTKFFALAASVFLGLVQPSAAAEAPQVLFFNPLVRDNAAPPKLQSLRFITVDNFAPFSAFDTTGTLRGIHVDLARAICAELQLTTSCTLQAVTFEDVENLLISGQAEVALAGLVPSEQSRKSLYFSVPYFRYPSKFLALKSTSLGPNAAIGVIESSVHQRMAAALFPDFKPTQFAKEADAIAALKLGTISALFGDGLQLALLKSGDPTLSCCELMAANYFLPIVRPDFLSAAISANRSDVLAAINSALRQMAVDGRLDEIYLRHLSINPLK
jgi:polar amino acid transport system substrate-binding protein